MHSNGSRRFLGQECIEYMFVWAHYSPYFELEIGFISRSFSNRIYYTYFFLLFLPFFSFYSLFDHKNITTVMCSTQAPTQSAYRCTSKTCKRFCKTSCGIKFFFSALWWYGAWCYCCIPYLLVGVGGRAFNR